MQLNDITFAGFLGKDAELRATPGGKEAAIFSLAHTEKGRDGREDVTTWVRVEAWGGWAKSASSYRKGDNVIVKGRLSVELYKDRASGADRTAVKIIAFSVGLLKKEESQGVSHVSRTPSSEEKQPSAAFDPGASALDDIPF